jgi:hypothetical protein
MGWEWNLYGYPPTNVHYGTGCWSLIAGKHESWLDGERIEGGRWLPDVDYNQAMMMRDEAIEPWDAGKVRAYTRALLDAYSANWEAMDMRYEYLIQVAFARCTARQIAEAALKVLEDNNG